MRTSGLPKYPHMCACLLWLPAVKGDSDRSRGSMGLAFKAAASRDIKPRPQQTAGIQGLTRNRQQMRFYA